MKLVGKILLSVLAWIVFDRLIDFFFDYLGVGLSPIGALLRVVPAVALVYLVVWYLPGRRASVASSQVAAQPPGPSKGETEANEPHAAPPPSPVSEVSSEAAAGDSVGLSTAALFCPYCGARTPADWSFCRACGKQIEDAAGQFEPEAEEPETVSAVAEPVDEPEGEPSEPDAVASPTGTSTRAGRTQRRWAWILIAVVAAGAAAAIAAYVIPSRSDSADTAALEAAIPAGRIVDVFTSPRKNADFLGLAVSGSLVAYSYRLSGNTQRHAVAVHDYSNDTEGDVAAGRQDQTYPALSGSRVVWVAGIQDGISGATLSHAEPYVVRLTVTTESAAFPAISGNTVVWDTLQSGDRIVGKSLTTGKSFTIPSGSGADMPAISGSTVVWQNDSHGSSGLDIRGYYLDSHTPIDVCVAPRAQTEPAIDGHIVVWQDDRNKDKDIYGKDLDTGEEFVVCRAPNYQFGPAVSGSVVVWADWRDYTTANIWVKNLDTGVEFMLAKTSNRKYARPVAIDGDLVVWVDGNSIKATRLKPEWMVAE
jgi:beta propeller repeat protein